MKQSGYNFFFETEEEGKKKYLAYNSLTNGLALMEVETVEFIKNIENEDLSNLRIKEDIFKELKNGGFIVEDGFDELKLLKLIKNQNVYDTRGFSLTILPTLDCNLGCKYCFEMRKPIHMDEKVEERLVEFVSENIEAMECKYFFVSWYGGEPLLKLDVIERLTEKFKNLCKERNCIYSASMVSNGTLITEEVAKRLSEMGITDVQVTLDGDPETHNVRRPYLDGRESFEDILNGIKNLAKFKIPISMRVNIDRTNRDLDLVFLEEYGLMEILQRDENGIHFGFVRPCTSTCGCSENECFTHMEFYEIENRLRRELFEKYNIESRFYPSPVYGCVATTPYGYVVGPRGELYKCWEDVGKESEEVGNIFNGVRMDKHHLDHLMLELDEECLNCKFLPLCNGGCPKTQVKRLRGENIPRDCTSYKFNMRRTLEYYYRNVHREEGEE